MEPEVCFTNSSSGMCTIKRSCHIFFRFQEPSFKEKKYDRQIRLWGLGGQKALETSKICLLNASGVGTETLKNLVLPGIGSFTIIDGQTVTEADLGNNFFVTEDDLGAPRVCSVSTGMPLFALND